MMPPHILVVEDDDTLRDIIAQTMHEAGYRVSQASHGEHAMRLLTQAVASHQAFDVIITDIVMGSIDGVEVTNFARSLPHPPEVILLTGHGSLETAMAAVRAGAFDYLLKPCRNAHLRERVVAALERRHAWLRKEEESQAWQTVATAFSQVQAQRDASGREGKEPPDASGAEPSPSRSPSPPSSDQPPPAVPPLPSTGRLQVGALSIDPGRHEVWFDDQPLHVTRTEYAILTYLIRQTGRVAVFSDIVRCTHGYELAEGEARELIRQHIRNLRKKIDRRYIVSVYGVGYMLVDPGE
ncbi:MAG: response regulator transcription factor [Chloroflexaceae bacterium]|nr:response regulator transcription factor [Chloroflexaceae bacterium]